VKRLLVALDGSPLATQVLATATRVAGANGAKLVLYRAVGLVPDMPMEVLNTLDGTLDELLLRNARNDLRRIAESTPPEVIDRIETDLASPWDGICRAAVRLDCDLIVIGSHGYSRFERVLGTTASKVVNHADRDVLVVRATQ
jgi:nucleotide-binding universal stress UspA family protein